MPKSPLSEIHQLLVGQKLDGWPQVQVLDDQGVDLRGVSVRFAATGGASFPATPNGELEVDTNNGGRAIALGLHGDVQGAAAVTVSLPESPETDSLEYRLNVVLPG